MCLCTHDDTDAETEAGIRLDSDSVIDSLRH